MSIRCHYLQMIWCKFRSNFCFSTVHSVCAFFQVWGSLLAYSGRLEWKFTVEANIGSLQWKAFTICKSRNASRLIIHLLLRKRKENTSFKRNLEASSLISLVSQFCLWRLGHLSVYVWRHGRVNRGRPHGCLHAVCIFSTLQCPVCHGGRWGTPAIQRIWRKV